MNASKDHVPDVAASVRQRLLNWSRERRTDFQLTLVRYASERFLYRLSRSAEADRFILKGALLLRLWTEQEFRPTRDVDFLGLGSENHEAIRSAIEEICIVDCPEDGLQFDHTMMRVESIRDEQEYGGVRVKLQSRLGVTRIPLQVDIGFGDVVTPAPIEENYPTLLDLPAPRLKTYPRETFVAEKFESMVRLGPTNSRMKDFWDVAVVAQQFEFEGEVLYQAIKATFTRRGTPLTEEVPEALRPAFYQDAGRIGLWRSFQQRVHSGIPMPTSFNAVGELVMSFLMPIRDNLVDGRPFGRTWLPGGPWRSAGFAGVRAQETRDATAQRGADLPKVPPGRFPPYPEYKNSGIEWLGEIPAHWDIGRFKTTVTSCQNGLWGDEPDGLNDIVCVRVADFDRISLRVNLSEPTFRAIEVRVLKTRLLKKGDLLLEKSGGGEKQPVGAVMIYEHFEPAVCSNFVARMPVAVGFSARYLTYLHAAAYAVRLNTCSIKQNTGIQNLDSGAYLNEQVAFPPLLEQRAIAAFLDRETAKIDAMVAKKQRLIELLQEKRTSLITRAVTKGLNPNVPMKDSGVEWLGEIPAHWGVAKLKHVCLLETGHTPQKSQPDYWIQDECVIPWISLNDTKTLASNDYISSTELMISERGMSNSAAHLIEEGAVVFNRDGARVGLAAVTTQPMALSQHIIGWVCDPRIRNEYVLYVIYALEDELYRLAVGATIPTIGMDDVKRLVTPVPSLEEQSAIIQHIKKVAAAIDKTVFLIRRNLDFLNEYRQALIFAAATGKIDVRREAV